MHTKTTRRQIARFLLVFWGLICLSNIVFRHAHRLPNGRIVSHTHFYTEFGSKCPFPNHQHTLSELTWLDCIGNPAFDAPLPDVVCPSAAVLLAPRLAYSYVEMEGGQRFMFHFLRGPPARLANLPLPVLRV
ncbi:hypothetical protein [Spirosoma areae]